MARNNRHNAAFVVGSVLGGLVGAAVALWKTPYSGEELRTRIAGAPQPAGGDVRHLTVAPAQGQSLKDKVLSTMETTLAPVVGVELGKTANDSGTVVREGVAVVGTKRTDGIVGNSEGVGEPPAEPDAGSSINEPYFETGGTSNMTPVDDSAGVPSNLSSPTRPPGDHEAASVEELTTPQVDRVPDALQQEEIEPQPFPDLGGDKSR